MNKEILTLIELSSPQLFENCTYGNIAFPCIKSSLINPNYSSSLSKEQGHYTQGMESKRRLRKNIMGVVVVVMVVVLLSQSPHPPSTQHPPPPPTIVFYLFFFIFILPQINYQWCYSACCADWHAPLTAHSHMQLALALHCTPPTNVSTPRKPDYH